MILHLFNFFLSLYYIKRETLESMARLYAVPSEKIRILTSWLIKVTEEADAWQSWVRSHIDLILRMSEYLIQAEEQLRPSSSDKPIENSSSNSIITPVNSNNSWKIHEKKSYKLHCVWPMQNKIDEISSKINNILFAENCDKIKHGKTWRWECVSCWPERATTSWRRLTLRN